MNDGGTAVDVDVDAVAVVVSDEREKSRDQVLGCVAGCIAVGGVGGFAPI